MSPMVTRTERPPYEAYAAIMGTFVAGLAATGVLARALGRDPREHTALDLITLAAATFKAAQRCVGTWTAAGLGVAQVLSPRVGRIFTWTLSAAGANDFLQAGFSALTAKANELEQRS